MSLAAFTLRLCASAVLFSSAIAQNVIEDRSTGPVLATAKVSAGFGEQLVRDFPKPDFTVPDNAEAKRVAAKLDAHVAEFLSGVPWKPFHHVLGISGYEVAFDHPDEMFYALSIALPYLSNATRERVGRFLAEQVIKTPPYATDGFDSSDGQPREAYDVPPALRRTGRGKATSVFGVAALYAYVNWAGYWCGEVPLDAHWQAVCERMRPLLETDYPFDPNRRDYGKDEAEKLNGDLAGLIAFARLADWRRDQESFARALPRIEQLAALRINLERLNPRFLEKTNSASKGLHNFKLARYCACTEDIAHCLREEEIRLASERLRGFRTARPGWWMAFGDRLVGGENYTNPLHFSRAMFTGAALIERLPPDELLRFADVPWCKGDLYFIEKCALALQRSGD